MIETDKNYAELKQSPVLIIHFFPGFFNAYRGSLNLENELLNLQGVKRVITENSVFSTDPPALQRFPEIGERLLFSLREIASSSDDKKMIIIINSGGGGEFVQTWKHMMRKNPHLVRQALLKTDFLLVSAAGMIGGLKGTVTTLNRIL